MVDASVAMRWYVDYPDSAIALELLKNGQPLIAPDLVVSEVGNTAWRLVQSGEISLKHGERIAAAIASAFTLLAPSAQLAARAFSLAVELEHSVYDCLYLTLADFESTYVLTADQRLLRKLRGSAHAHLARPLESLNG